MVFNRVIETSSALRAELEKKMKASELKAGDKVMYHSTPATVFRVRANGVTVQYWYGEQLVTKRVAARYLTAA